MPFGRKQVGSLTVDFDAVYADVIVPAVTAVGLQPLRADEERFGGIIHKQMFERLVLCDYAVADLSGANANVFYELGVRHGTRPRSTVLLFAEQMLPPFDLGPMRAMSYRLGIDGRVENPDTTRDALVKALQAARAATHDSPLYELLQGFPALDHAKTDVFREQVDYSEGLKAELRAARGLSNRSAQVAAIANLEQRLGHLHDAELGVLVDLLLSYRDAEAYDEMVRLTEAMPRYLASSVLVQEQRAFALNRLGRRHAARDILEELIRRRGAAPETCGLLGRVLKDSWQDLRNAGRAIAAAAMLDRAIAAYRLGFEADWRDAYPGINAVTLMELREPPDPALNDLLPVVRYAVARKMTAGRSDYWDHATQLELAVVARDEPAALAALGQAQAELSAKWQVTTTVGNLRLIRNARAARGEACAWVEAIERELLDQPAPRNDSELYAG